MRNTKSYNDITGDRLISKKNIKAYDDNYDRIFRKNRISYEERGRDLQSKSSEEERRDAQEYV